MTDNNKKNIAPVEPFVRRNRPFFVALFILIPTLAVPALLYFTVIKSDAFHKWHTLHVIYENSQGLKQGSQVSMSGTTIGHVKSVDLIMEKVVHVDFNVNSRYIHLVKKDTKARMKQRGFMGDWEIELYGGSSHAAAEAGDTLSPERLPSVDDIIEAAIVVFDTAVTLLSDVAALVNGITAGEGTVGQLFKNDTLYRRINVIGANTVSLTADARALTADVRGLVASDVRGTIRSADSLLSALSSVSSTMGESGAALIDSLKIMVNTINKSFDDIETILGNIKTVSESAPDLMDRIKDDLEEAELLMQSLQKNWLFRAVGGKPPKNPSLMETP